MKQLEIRITDIHGKNWGIKKVMSCNWDEEGNLWVVNVNFMETNNSNDYAPFYDYKNSGKFNNISGNLIGKLIQKL